MMIRYLLLAAAYCLVGFFIATVSVDAETTDDPITGFTVLVHTDKVDVEIKK